MTENNSQNIKAIGADSMNLARDQRNTRLLLRNSDTEPYVIAHDDAEQLSDDVLKARMDEYLATGAEISCGEEFEQFLYHLRDQWDYYLVLETDSPLDFRIAMA